MASAMVVTILTTTIAIAAAVDNSEDRNVPMDIMSQIDKEISDEAGTLQDTRYLKNSSIFGNYQRYYLTYQNDNFSFDLYQTEQEWLLDLVWENELAQVPKTEFDDCTALWNAETAFRNQESKYYIRYGNAVLIIDLSEKKVLSADQVAHIRDALELE